MAIPFTIVTGASQNFYRYLLQFLRSIPNGKIVSQCYIYDLGLAPESRKQIEDEFPEYILRTFDFSKYPEYFNININAGQYAWKPVIIREVAQEVHGIVLWCDTRNFIHESLSQLREIVMQQGIYSPTSMGNLQEWTHYRTQRYFGIQNNFLFLAKQCRAGGLVAFNIDSDPVRAVIDKWAECAQIEDCIAPLGSDRRNHRQDQSVLSILYYMFHKNAKTENRYLTISVHNELYNDDNTDNTDNTDNGHNSTD